MQVPHRTRVNPALDDQSRLINPADLIGAAEASRLLGINHRSTLTRRIEAGEIPWLAQLDGQGGAYVFDRTEITALAIRTEAMTQAMPKVALA